MKRILNGLRRLLGIAILLCVATVAMAQSVEDRAREELERRGLGDEEVRKRLAQRGIDVDAIDINNPTEIFRLEKSIKEVLDELEKEKATKTEGQGAASDSPTLDEVSSKGSNPNLSEEEAKILAKEGEEISKAIDEGSTLEEAVSEELIESQGEQQSAPVRTYGQQIFREQNIKLYRQSQDVKPPESYILGVGDILAVSIWGYSEEDLLFEIGNDGYIKPEGIPRIYLKGLSLGDTKELLYQRLSNYYRFNRNEYEVALNYGRTINVDIIGEVYNYGTFNIPAINTAFNALVASGGPNDIGSVRNIKLYRDGVPTQNLDVYQFLTDPAYARDFYLQEKDRLYVPIAEKLVTISGAVIRPARYELREGEQLTDLINFAGGLKPTANFNTMQIQRYIQGEQILIDVSLTDIMDKGKDVDLQNGDRVIIYEKAMPAENYVTISGSVEQPGRFAIDGKTTRLADVLERAELKAGTYLDVAYLKRRNEDRETFTYYRLDLDALLSDSAHPDNIVLQGADEIVLYQQSRFVENESFSIIGNVRDPNTFTYDFSKTLRLSDAVLLAGGLKHFTSETAFITRVDSTVQGGKKYIASNVVTAVNSPGGDADMLILPGDRIEVISMRALPNDYKVSTNGHVFNPREFVYDESLTVARLIDMSGGLQENATDFAYIQRIPLDRTKEKQYLRIDLSSSDTLDFVLQPRDRIVFYAQDQFQDQFSITVDGAVKRPGTFVYGANMSLRDLIVQSGGLKFNASRSRIDVFRLDFDDDNDTKTLAATIEVDDEYNVIGAEVELQPFDEIYVREAPDFELIKKVKISGEVRYPGEYAILSDTETLADVIERAGGTTSGAFLEGGRFYRAEYGVGFIRCDFVEAVKNPRSPQNIVVKNLDEIVIPTVKNTVSILGEINYNDAVNAGLTDGQQLVVPYIKGLRADDYVNDFAGGFQKDADRNAVYVLAASGTVKKSRKFLFWKRYPKVGPGDQIVVRSKPPEKEKTDSGERVDWAQVFGDSIAVATSVLTLLLLANRLD